MFKNKLELHYIDSIYNCRLLLHVSCFTKSVLLTLIKKTVFCLLLVLEKILKWSAVTFFGQIAYIAYGRKIRILVVGLDEY